MRARDWVPRCASAAALIAGAFVLLSAMEASAARTPPTAAAANVAADGPEVRRSWRTACAVGEVEVRMSVSRSRATVAQRVEVVMEAAMPAGVRVEWPAELSEIEGFTSLASEESEGIDGGPGRRQVRRVAVLEPFLPGVRVLGTMTVRFVDARGESCELRTEPVRIEVVSLLGEGEPPEPELRGIVEPQRGPGLAYWLAVIVPPVLAMGGLAVLALRRRKPRMQEPPTPYEEALRRLAALEEAPERGGGSERAAALGVIVRRFVAGELGLPAADRTTEQLLTELEGRPDMNVPAAAELLGRLDEAGFSGAGLSAGEWQELRDRAHTMIVGLHSARGAMRAGETKGGS